MSEMIMLMLLPAGVFGGYTLRYMWDEHVKDVKAHAVDCCKNCFHNTKHICDRTWTVHPDNYYCNGHEVNE